MAKGIWMVAGLGGLLGCWIVQGALVSPTATLLADEPTPAEEAESAQSPTPATPQPTPAQDDGEVIATDKPAAPKPASEAPLEPTPAVEESPEPIRAVPAKPVRIPSDEEPAEAPNEPTPAQAAKTPKPAVPVDDPTPAPSTLEAKSMVTQAYEMTKRANFEKEYREIVHLCRQALRASLPETTAAYARRLKAWAHNRLGEVCADTGRTDEALDNFEQAVELDPHHWRAVHNRGVAYATMARYDEAIADFDHTIKLNRNYPSAWFNRAELLYEQGKYTEAVADYTEVLRLQPDDAAALNSRGHSYYRLEKFREAAADYNQSLKLDPNNAAAYTNRGDVYAEVGDYEQAGADYQSAIRVDPELGRAYQSAAWLMATCSMPKFRNGQLAVEAAMKAIELDGDKDPRYLETLAAAQAAAGDFTAAQQTQSRVLQVVSKSDYEKSEQRLSLYKKRMPYRETPRRLSRRTTTEQ